MEATLNLYLDPELSYTWRQASFLAAKSQGHGKNRARNLRTWIHRYLSSGKLPVHCSGQYNSSILEHEDLADEIHCHLVEIAKEGYICTQDVVDFISTPEIQEKLGSKARGISIRTAQRWMKKHEWRYGKKAKGMYMDGHEREDVVAYRDGFVARWQEYEKRMVTFDNDGVESPFPPGFPVAQTGRFRLILITHDESTFYAYDRRKSMWSHVSDPHVPDRKGEGPSLMISDMLTSEWGRLVYEDEEARVVFKAGKNRDGWFASGDLLQQVEKSIDIFEAKTNRFATGLFLFDNAPSHQRRADDALSARKMPKRPNEGWTHRKDGPHMRGSSFGPLATPQDFYFPDDHPTMPGWFKGMEEIIRERGLWPENGLRAQCEGFKCVSGATDCCCRRLLFCQPDFQAQKSQLEEYITVRGHLCDFYPKYHCEL
ncbi:hypothetical protein FIBSPDRAFT_769167, partial [Athelia psychrophila]